MHAIEVVFDHQLPIAVVSVLEHPARHLEVAIGCPINHVVEGTMQRTEKILKRGTARCLRGKYETAVTFDARHACEPEAGKFLFCIGTVALRHRHNAQRAVSGKGPAMIGTGELPGAAPRLVANQRTAMAAPIYQHLQAAVGMTRYDHRLATELRGKKIPAVANLAFMPHEQPGAPEQPVHFQLENVRIGVNGVMDTVGLNQPRQVFIFRAFQAFRITDFHAVLSLPCLRASAALWPRRCASPPLTGVQIDK